MTTLEDLWYGNIAPFEQYLDGNEKYQELLMIMSRDREKLSDGFQLDKIEWLEKYDAVLNEMASLAEMEAFKFGYKLAVRTMIESK